MGVGLAKQKLRGVAVGLCSALSEGKREVSKSHKNKGWW